ncbi:MAG: PAS domain S-box protein [Nostoc sp. ChiSLP02]|nr:PAS domain S-box protein [Nostoc sp. DedSLP05]MDZ8101892.1 PAS domain S-box protein [Nostoc sp. DedSLP01]MDZ8186165.1 PAS domain S-box protein [Nostoc sp. ChiSLP02]
MEFLNNFLFSNQFIPHGHCYLWKPGLVLLHLLSDVLTGLAYYSIPVMLVYFVRKRRDVPFDWMFLMFSTFIVACGTTHLMDVWTLWYPTYWLSGLIKAITAFVSVVTALELIPLIPQALVLPSPAQLETANSQLATEIAERKRTEEILRESEQRLESMVEERTAELTKINQSLQAEITQRQRIEVALRESEQRFRSAFDQAAVGIAHVGIDGRWLLVNQRLCDIVGYTPKELQSLTFQDITHPDDLETDLKYVEYILADRIQTFSMEKRYFRKDTSIVWVNLTVSLIRESSKEPKYLIAVIEDISDRKRSQEQIKASLLEKEVLLKEIYHRVKNNLQVISSLLNLQSAYIKNQDDLAIFQQSQQRIASIALIHEKLYQSQDLARVNFREYIQDLVASLFTAYEVSEEAIAVSIDIDEDVFLGLDTAIPCSLIIHELVSNSLKYAFPAGRNGSIFIHLHRSSDNNFILKVSDDGIGLPSNFDLQKISSLGLQLVDALTYQLSGSIQIKGDMGVESQLTFPII